VAGGDGRLQYARAVNAAPDDDYIVFFHGR
jgi:hypothetical protein